VPTKIVLLSVGLTATSAGLVNAVGRMLQVRPQSVLLNTPSKAARKRVRGCCGSSASWLPPSQRLLSIVPGGRDGGLLKVWPPSFEYWKPAPVNA